MAAIPVEMQQEVLRLAFLQPTDPLCQAALELVIGVHPETGVVREGDYRRLVRALSERLRG